LLVFPEYSRRLPRAWSGGVRVCNPANAVAHRFPRPTDLLSRHWAEVAGLLAASCGSPFGHRLHRCWLRHPACAARLSPEWRSGGLFRPTL